MKQYLSKTVIWFTPTKEQIALNEKLIIIVYPQGNCQEARLQIQRADGPGKYSASVSLIDLPPADEEWSNVGSFSATPARPIGQWERFLSQDVLNLVRRNDSGLSRAELLIELPSDSEPSDH